MSYILRRLAAGPRDGGAVLLGVALALLVTACGAAPPHAEPVATGDAPTVRADPVCATDQRWVHAPIWLQAVTPARPLPADQRATLRELVESVNANRDVVVVRVESRGCVGEATATTLARADIVARAIEAAGLREGVTIGQVAYAAVGRGCYCSCEMLEQVLAEAPSDTKGRASRTSHGAPKNCAEPIRETCRRQASSIFRVEISLLLEQCVDGEVSSATAPS